MMSRMAGKVSRIDHVELRVRDLAHSAAFYEDVLGLSRADEDGYGDGVRVYRSDALGAGFSIVLVAGAPRGMGISGLDHLSLEVATARDVDEIHAAAKSSGARTTDPAMRCNRYQTYVFDPNGYKIEVAARPRPGHYPQAP